MKYFTNEWYKSGCKFTNEFLEKVKKYDDFIKGNYDYYPQWYKERNDKKFIFHDAVIKKFIKNKNNIIIILKNFELTHKNRTYRLTLNNAKIIESPKEIERKSIVADELYCNNNCSELHLLLLDNDTHYTGNLTIQFTDSILERKIFCLKSKI